MARLLIKARTLLALGIVNILRVAWFRLGVRFGWNPVRRLRVEPPEGPFFTRPGPPPRSLPVPDAWWHFAQYFGHYPVPVGEAPPAWHANPISGGAVPRPKRPWWRIPDFDGSMGDIKLVWEASRFDWLVAYAQRAASGQPAALERINFWLADWCASNSPYDGPNWKCGQEASIRVMHLLLAAQLLGQTEQPRSALMQLVVIHLQRILPTISYAIAQNNNHGTSEASALFMGGAWLVRLGYSDGERYRRVGRKWLENRARRLIMPDGTFSQYSVNYHRVMLDTYAWTERWRCLMDEPAFSNMLYRRLQLATDWLANMVVAGNGDAPNMGANDGARLIPLTGTDHRDYRPSVQLATVLFYRAAAYSDDGDYDLPLAWLGLSKPSAEHRVCTTRDYPTGGFVVLRRGSIMALLRYPVFRFRPSQSDLLHVDLWYGETNVLRDAGTYSYNSGDQFQEYFGSVAAHNTVQFDGRDQMPKLSRFLYGAWPRTRCKTPVYSRNDAHGCTVAYRDWQGAWHQREIRLFDTSMVVVDVLDSFRDSAILRWRLCRGDWKLVGNKVTGEHGNLVITADGAGIELRLIEGWESRYYNVKAPLIVLEVTVRKPCTITSEMNFP